jgi:hypothetical protein
VETAGPLGGDANNDGTPDSQQGHITALIGTVADRPIVLIAPSGQALEDVYALLNPAPAMSPADVTFPLGLVNFQLTGVAVGGATTVMIPLPTGVTANSYYKYGPTADNTTPHFYEFLFDAVTNTGAQFFDDNADGTNDRVVLHLVDGGRGDSDLTANGVIADPGAVAGVTQAMDGELTANVEDVQPRRDARGKKVLGVDIVFDQAVDPQDAVDPVNYRLTSAGKDRLFGTRDDKPLRLRSLTYEHDDHDAAAEERCQGHSAVPVEREHGWRRLR